jgi:hypothetical protein
MEEEERPTTDALRGHLDNNPAGAMRVSPYRAEGGNEASPESGGS